MANRNQRIALFKHIKQYAKTKNIYLDFINGHSDHVHALISLSCDQNIAQIAKLLKGESSNWANKNNIFGTDDFEWADSYYAVSVSCSQVEAVRNYIKNQETHHQKNTFEQECDAFISQFGFAGRLGEPLA